MTKFTRFQYRQTNTRMGVGTCVIREFVQINAYSYLFTNLPLYLSSVKDILYPKEGGT